MILLIYEKENMKRRSLSENAANSLTRPFEYQTSRPGVCQINSVNLNLTARIKVQTLEIYWALLVCLIILSVVTC
jgi:hypothetical protein